MEQLPAQIRSSIRRRFGRDLAIGQYLQCSAPPSSQSDRTTPMERFVPRKIDSTFITTETEAYATSQASIALSMLV
jgi:hypothetical protein